MCWASRWRGPISLRPPRSAPPGSRAWGRASGNRPPAVGCCETRLCLVGRTAQALVAIGGGVGTLSEIALAQRIGKPVVGLHDSFRNAVDIPRVQTAAAAVAWALEWAQKGMV